MHVAQAPHCDELVLHAPGKCIYCDKYPEAQQNRIENNINFTGEDNPDNSKCPSEMRRAVGDIYRWPGNIPKLE